MLESKKEEREAGGEEQKKKKKRSSKKFTRRPFGALDVRTCAWAVRVRVGTRTFVVCTCMHI